LNIGNNPELLDKLCAAYALGTMKGGARKRLETYARQSATVRATMLLWQERLVAMVELVPQQTPSENVWTQIAAKLQQEIDIGRQSHFSALSESSEKLFRAAISRWRSVAAMGALATAASVLIGWQQYSQVRQANLQLVAAAAISPQLRYVAVLADEQSKASILITVDAKNNRVAIQRVGQFKESDEKSLQLWAIPKNGAPTSLSVLDAEKLMRVNVANTLLDNSEILAVSLEAKGGVPSERGPVGPVLFKGQLLAATM
jgi:anti-sigma-K factor RskA